MPLPVKERLQRRLAARNTSASGAPSDPSDVPLSADESANVYYRRGFGPSDLEEAKKCFPSLVEEIAPANCISSCLDHCHDIFSLDHCPDIFSNYHSAVTYISLCPFPDMRNAWQRLVRDFDLQHYYAMYGDKIHAELKHQADSGMPSISDDELAAVSSVLAVVQLIVGKLKQWTVENVSSKLSIGDTMLSTIFDRLAALDFYAVGAVCRRWHFVGRCAWNLALALQIRGSDVAPSLNKGSHSLRAAKLIYRVPLITTIAFSDVAVSFESLILDASIWPYLTTLHLCNVTIASTTRRGALWAEANERICRFIKERKSLLELVLVSVQLCCSDDRIRRQRVARPLDFQWRLPEAKCDDPPRDPIENVQLSLSLLGRQKPASFEEFCLVLMLLQSRVIILSGLASWNPPAVLSEAAFGHCLAEMMPGLREVSFCNVKFGNTAHLKFETIDLLAKNIRYDSNLELFCLTNGEISEEAICNLQRCRNLQILILLRCTITKANPDLRLMAGWHPSANLPSSLITDCVTVPRWFKPTYFRVVRIKNFPQFNESKFAELRKRWWTIGALSRSCELGLDDYCYGLPTPHEDEAEDILADAFWFHLDSGIQDMQLEL